jgi:hypothetical protein
MLASTLLGVNGINGTIGAKLGPIISGRAGQLT